MRAPIASRLQRRLVLEEHLAVEVFADAPWTLDPGLFTIGLTVRPDVSPERATDLLHEELRRIATEPPPDLELRARVVLHT